ncbi:hypothetical protein BDR06DRAFT_979247 [Suillus hirtellus]|nr:hypothetical protein BDR06DRAFT_979247 [Suillus hirtellus]
MLTAPCFEDHPAVSELISHNDDIICTLSHHVKSRTVLLEWARTTINADCAREVQKLTKVDNAWQFSMLHANAEKIECFCIEDMAMEIEAEAPMLWGLLDAVLSMGHARTTTNAEKENLSKELKVKESEYWCQVDDLEVVVVSLLTKSVNQKANTLSSVLGIFLHLTHAPKSVIETMSRMGFSISVHAIHDAICALSAQSCHALQYLGQTLLAAYAYDNFDVHLKSTVPTAEKSADTLKHLKSGLLFPLQHGVTHGDLKCDLAMEHTWKDLLSLHQDTQYPSELTRRDHFNSWKFLHDLCYHGPPYFAQFQLQISDPKIFKQIPVVETPIVAASAMDVNNSTVVGNIQAIESLMMQGGICDPAEVEDDKSPDILEYIVLVHGDLGIGKRIASLQQRRSIEKTPWHWFQHIVFMPRLFHFKMVAVDAIWRALIQPTSACQDLTSLMHDIAQLWPHETGIFVSKPGFQMMHQLIGHDGICRHLDCWHTEVKRMNNTHKTLANFAMTKPSLDELKKIADQLAREYNNLLINKYFLLYKQLSHAMNVGDIVRVETCMIPWALIFKDMTGKHKYATVMIEFLKNLHFMYPAGLQ